jgi:hypothetical protein
MGRAGSIMNQLGSTTDQALYVLERVPALKISFDPSTSRSLHATLSTQPAVWVARRDRRAQRRHRRTVELQSGHLESAILTSLHWFPSYTAKASAEALSLNTKPTFGGDRRAAQYSDPPRSSRTDSRRGLQLWPH